MYLKLIFISFLVFLIRGMCWALPVLGTNWAKLTFPEGFSENDGMKIKHFVTSFLADSFMVLLSFILIVNLKQNLSLLITILLLFIIVLFFKVLETVLYAKKPFLSSFIEFFIFTTGLLFSFFFVYIMI
ncbi:MAG: hypothetical protein ACRCS8_06705 [Brevinema sp.]